MLEKLMKYTKILIVFIIVVYILQTLLIGKIETRPSFLKVVAITNYSFPVVRNLMTSKTSENETKQEEVTDGHMCTYDASKHTGKRFYNFYLKKNNF